MVVGRLSEMGEGVDDGDCGCALKECDAHCEVAATAATSTSATGMIRDRFAGTPAPFCPTKYHLGVYYSRLGGGWV
jgi:hypothetical protein